MPNINGIAAVILVDETGAAIASLGGGVLTLADGASVTLGHIADTAYDGVTATTSQGYLRTIADSARSTAPANIAGTVSITDISSGEYETVAASQTGRALGATGATGDYLAGLLVIPATTSPGQVLLLDNAISITVFTGGASSVSNLIPFFIPIGAKSVSGAWKVTTGTNVSVFGVGNFT